MIDLSYLGETISNGIAELGKGVTAFLGNIENALGLLYSQYGGVPVLFTLIARWILPLLAFVILYKCFVSLLSGKTQPETWAYLSLPNGARVPVNHWENAVGRGPLSDIVLKYPAISRSHAVLSRHDDGSWKVFDLNSKGGVQVNGNKVLKSAPVSYGDVISFSGVETVLIELPEEEKREMESARIPHDRYIKPMPVFFLLTLFELITALMLCFALESDILNITVVYLTFIAVQWAYFIIMRALRRTGFEVELIAFLLTSIGLSVTASAAPDSLFKQYAAVLIGIVIFILLGSYLRDLERAKNLRWYMAAAALILLAVNLILGESRFGAKNWLNIGGYTVQPSEFVKIAFIYVGASTLDRLLSARNLYMFIGFSGACVLALFLMGDFGTTAVFFITFIVIAFMRSGDYATISLIIAGAGFGTALIMRFKPYIAERFSAWGHVWEYADTLGYQQTRTMIYASSGGLLGLGAGNGQLTGVAAADTDLVFGVLCEEWGLLVALMAALSFAGLAVFAVRSIKTGRSSFYAIASNAAVSLLLFQMCLNVFGSVDVLPLTGVTFPFISSGGSSVAASWGLLAFIKSADTRKNASFVIPLKRKLRGWNSQ